MRRLYSAFVVTGALLFTACDTTAEPARPLQVTLQSTRTTAARGDTVVFQADVQGGSLIGVIVDFGDGTSEPRQTSGATSAKLTFRHAYTTAGTFTVQATATDASAGDKSATVQVVIT